ncbi:hypothetical protein FOL46_009423 [Perkinsus olseni]|uniref:Chromo domain-containing protein n=1 Tax=Perkinsus olseni TaxID=32597 RepID=A0A7J6L198_PEROL|nr:hypothetical protein FOL46_009423 [Perkinsus olseni]
MVALAPRHWLALGLSGLCSLALAADRPGPSSSPQTGMPHIISSEMLVDFQGEVSAWLHKVYQAVWVEQPEVVFNLLTFLLGFSSVTLVFVLMVRQYVFKARREDDRLRRKQRRPSISVRDSAFEKSSSAKRRGSTSRGRRDIPTAEPSGTEPHKPAPPAIPSQGSTRRSPSHRAKPKSHSSRTSTPQKQMTPASSTIMESDSPEEHIRSRIPGRPSPVPTKIAGDDGRVYEIDSIVDSRMVGDGEEFLVTWVGYPPTSSTWEPAPNLPRHLIQEFKEFSSSSRARRHVKPPPPDSD